MAKSRMEKVMSKFKHGTLRSSSGKKVTDRDQALAIGMNDSGKSKKGKRKKKS